MLTIAQGMHLQNHAKAFCRTIDIADSPNNRPMTHEFRIRTKLFPEAAGVPLIRMLMFCASARVAEAPHISETPCTNNDSLRL